MPDKWQACVKGCPRCWKNRLKHGNGVKHKTLTTSMRILRRNLFYYQEHPRVKILPWEIRINPVGRARDCDRIAIPSWLARIKV